MSSGGYVIIGATFEGCDVEVVVHEGKVHARIGPCMCILTRPQAMLLFRCLAVTLSDLNVPGRCICGMDATEEECEARSK